jgi:predicted chitinase
VLTIDELEAIMPQLPAAKGASLYPFLSAAIAEFAIEAPARTAAFLAQLAHESAQFRFMEEIWGPTDAQRRYEPPSTLATKLGNTEPGDGLRFKGRGPIQITGRSNYRRFGDLLGLDLIADPPKAAQPDVAFRIAGLFWSKKGLNELADRVTQEAFREITRRINGGSNGQTERERFYEVAKNVLGVTGPSVSRGARVPAAVAEPAFDRGHEAIRVDPGTSVADTAAKKKTVTKARSVKKVAAKKTVVTKKTVAKKTGRKKHAPAKKTIKPRKEYAKTVKGRKTTVKSRPSG